MVFRVGWTKILKIEYENIIYIHVDLKHILTEFGVKQRINIDHIKR